MVPVWLPVAVLGLFIAVLSLWKSIYFGLQKRRAYKQQRDKERAEYKSYSVLD
jgi:hypothetical protein